MNQQSTATSSEFSVAGTVFAVFLILKLTHVLHWSWWWITAPLWGSVGLFIVVTVISGVLVSIVGRDRRERRRRRS